MKPEQAFYQKLRPMLPGQVTRIENSAVPGLSDVLVISNGITNWIELKVPDPLILLRKEQYAWNMQHSQNGGRNFLFVLRGEIVHIWRYPVISVTPYGNTHKYVRVNDAPFYSSDWVSMSKVITTLFTTH